MLFMYLLLLLYADFLLGQLGAKIIVPIVGTHGVCAIRCLKHVINSINS